jgi:hypothetical protein
MIEYESFCKSSVKNLIVMLVSFIVVLKYLIFK